MTVFLAAVAGSISGAISSWLGSRWMMRQGRRR